MKTKKIRVICPGCETLLDEYEIVGGKGRRLKQRALSICSHCGQLLFLLDHGKRVERVTWDDYQRLHPDDKQWAKQLADTIRGEWEGGEIWREN